MSFTPSIPASGQTLGQTRQSILNNFAILRSTIAVDHNDVNASNNGYHKVIHYQNQGSDPAVVAGVGQLYTKTANGSQQLFYENGLGIISQLTGPNAPSGATNGYAWVGPILIQWGKRNSTSSSGNVVFATSNINFPNALFNVTTTGFYNSSTPGSQVTYAVDMGSTFNTTQFNWTRITNSSDYNGFYWIAIGN